MWSSCETVCYNTSVKPFNSLSHAVFYYISSWQKLCYHPAREAILTVELSFLKICGGPLMVFYCAVNYYPNWCMTHVEQNEVNFSQNYTILMTEQDVSASLITRFEKTHICFCFRHHRNCRRITNCWDKALLRELAVNGGWGRYKQILKDWRTP